MNEIRFCLCAIKMNSTKNNNNKKCGKNEANENCFDVCIEIFTYISYLFTICPFKSSTRTCA